MPRICEKGFLFLAFFVMFSHEIKAQDTWDKDKSHILDADTYASEENAFYWKKHLPFPDYWQQDVHYRILANLKPEENKIEGRMTLRYTNHSPDELNEVYFHLYQNAFTPNSYYDKLSLAQRKKNNYGYHGEQGKGTEIQQVLYNQRGIDFEIDNTLMKITLPKPIKPGQAVLFDMKFTTYFSEGELGGNRRMKIIEEEIKRNDGLTYKVNHYDVVHWYPRIVVYDRKHKWNLHQHLGSEFYGDFGSFDAHITIPQHYILDGTGVLQNEEEVLPAELKARINIENFKDKKWEEIASEIFPANNLKTKTWVFHAQNVHDFAFTADPTYRRGEVRIGNVRCISLARERHAARWQDAASFTAKVIETYSEDFGEYVYPKMIVADADDGMEYPMLTLDGEGSPEYYGLLAHEIGHNWFFGMLGTNETYRAFMDEGFTQFAQNWATEKLIGKHSFMLDKYSFLVEKEPSRMMEVIAPYLQDAIYQEDGTLNTHSDDFSRKSPSHNYGQVYTKTATMLYDLKYVLGEETFLEFMQYYFHTWKIKHPYPEDFRQALTDFTQNDFSWFFDQWLETTKQLDYAVASIKPYRGDTTKVMLRKIGQMHQPVEVKIITKYETFYYYIPVSDYIKPLPETVKILPKWTSIGELSPNYTMLVPARGIKQVIIDPLGESPEINRLNNQRFPKIKFKAYPYNKVAISGNWEAYQINLRPNIWWNGFSGLQVGTDFRGAYLKELHKTSLNLWYNTGFLQIPKGNNWETTQKEIQPLSFRFTYSTLLRKLGKNNYVNFAAMMRDGRHRYFAEFEHLVPFGTHHSDIYHRFYVQYILLYQGKTQYGNYLLYPTNWETNALNASILAGFDKQYQAGWGKGKLNLTARASALGGQKAYTYFS
ncbi:MAG: M1 family metallopeptidase, partial [Bacteroidia bacterium]